MLFCLLQTREALSVQDLGFCGPSFTWQRGATSVRLDRALANDEWMLTFPQCLVHHLIRIKSNHRPLLLSTNHNLDLEISLENKWIYLSTDGAVARDTGFGAAGGVARDS
ncbi:hypothetical protein J1N35_012279 [Gossypium stocksii]|uniref:Endonuclease/exonuclease/phosphatase domain-containing protein n=1 Tax=Gossypium stocksii TaxID=47602 RepID=A0A9D4AEC6_9ROSI|nr:hypothetical protein J1N35_012279 [Gossypium stocksii]